MKALGSHVTFWEEV